MSLLPKYPPVSHAEVLAYLEQLSTREIQRAVRLEDNGDISREEVTKNLACLAQAHAIVVTFFKKIEVQP